MDLKLRRTFRLMDKYLEHGNFAAVEKYLREADFTRMSELEIIGLLRATYRARNACPNWDERVSDARLELIARGYPKIATLMAGLIRETNAP